MEANHSSILLNQIGIQNMLRTSEMLATTIRPQPQPQTSPPPQPRVPTPSVPTPSVPMVPILPIQIKGKGQVDAKIEEEEEEFEDGDEETPEVKFQSLAPAPVPGLKLTPYFSALIDAIHCQIQKYIDVEMKSSKYHQVVESIQVLNSQMQTLGFTVSTAKIPEHEYLSNVLATWIADWAVLIQSFKKDHRIDISSLIQDDILSTVYGQGGCTLGNCTIRWPHGFNGFRLFRGATANSSVDINALFESYHLPKPRDFLFHWLRHQRRADGGFGYFLKRYEKSAPGVKSSKLSWFLTKYNSVSMSNQGKASG